MYAVSKTMIETEIFPDVEADFPLPENLIMKFAEEDDFTALKVFLKKHNHSIETWEYALERGRIIIFKDPGKDKIYSAAYSEKISTKKDPKSVKVFEPVSEIPWVAFNLMMLSALYTSEYARDKDAKIILENKVSYKSFGSLVEAEDYLKRAQNISEITCGQYKMSLRLDHAIEDIKLLMFVKGAISRRCGL